MSIDALKMLNVDSPAFDAVSGANHPSPECGGPCATCAFRPGTEAASMEHTVVLARLCVEATEPFLCHEQPQLCRGWIAAVNLRGPMPDDDDSRHRREALGFAIEMLNEAIEVGVQADREHERKRMRS